MKIRTPSTSIKITLSRKAKSRQFDANETALRCTGGGRRGMPEMSLGGDGKQLIRRADSRDSRDVHKRCPQHQIAAIPTRVGSTMPLLRSTGHSMESVIYGVSGSWEGGSFAVRLLAHSIASFQTFSHFFVPFFRCAEILLATACLHQEQPPPYRFANSSSCRHFFREV